jgi:hypothetical protein
MPISAKRGRTIHSLALPFIASLSLHGLLVAGLWYWPVPQALPSLAIESARLTVDTCVVETPSASFNPGPEWSEALVPVDVAFAPQLHEAAPLPQDLATEAGPKLVQDPTVPPVGGASEPSSRGAGGDGGDLFPPPGNAGSVVYVIDRSVSMGIDRKLEFARRELISRLRRLPSSVRFQVIDYNEFAELLVVDDCGDLLPAVPAIVERAAAHLLKLEAGGTTNHVAALRRALDLKPDAIYFLTDAGDLQPHEVADITRRNRRRSAIHTLELTRRRSPQQDAPLAQLSRENGGTCRRVWLHSME